MEKRVLLCKFGQSGAFKEEMDSLTNNSDTSLCSSRFSLTDCHFFSSRRNCAYFFFILADDSADCVTHQLILRVGHRSLSDPSHHSRTVRCHHGTKWPNIFPKKTNKFFRFGIDKNPHHCLAAQPKWCGSWNLFQNANFTLEVKCWACYNYLCVIYPKPFVRQLDVHLPTSWCRIRWEAAKLNIYRPV